MNTKMKKSLMEAEPEVLMNIISELEIKLKKKNEMLSRARMQLSKARVSVQRLKGIVLYQRERILKLYE
jgi:hypothetical protein